MRKAMTGGLGRRADYAGGLAIAGAVFEIDAANSASYPGSGQTLFNIVSSPADSSAQSAYDFWLGDDDQADGNDPAFAGSAGAGSSNEYFSFSGTELRLKGANTTFIESIHKAGAAFTIAVAYWATSSGGGDGMVLNNVVGSSSASTGFQVQEAVFVLRDGNVAADLSYTYATAPTTNAWNVLVLSIDEAAGLGRCVVNGNFHTFSASYPSPSGGASDGAIRVGREVSGGGAFGGRLARMGMWNTAHEQAALEAIHDDWATRFA